MANYFIVFYFLHSNFIHWIFELLSGCIMFSANWKLPNISKDSEVQHEWASKSFSILCREKDSYRECKKQAPISHEKQVLAFLYSIFDTILNTTKTVQREPGNGINFQMVRKFPMFRSKRKNRSTSGGSPQFPKWIFQKLSDPFDFQPKFPDFFG